MKQTQDFTQSTISNVIFYKYLVQWFCLLVFVNACGTESQTLVELENQEEDLRQLLKVPPHFSLPRIPEFNIPTAEKINLGKHLFYDTRLSGNESQSCNSCHFQALAFADDVTQPRGSTGDILVRNSQGLANAMYHATFTWASDSFLDLENQLQVPIRSTNPIELGVTETVVDEVLARFDSDPLYAEMFRQAFPDSEPGATINKIIHALASFLRTLISGASAYDQYLLGDENALTAQQLQGLAIFNGEKFECFHCHSGINFSTSYRDNTSNPDTQIFPFFNNGLYNVNGTGDYPSIDQGLFDLTQKSHHRGFFRPQSLRNVAVTAPYMHDGSIETLREVIEHYARGGRLVETGLYAGDGALSPLKSGFIRGFDATDEEIEAVIAFLESLTDHEFLTNPAHSNPFNEE
ncbi:MAG: MbnH family di-heme enzyme [Pseudomonadota bacterium]